MKWYIRSSRESYIGDYVRGDASSSYKSSDIEDTIMKYFPDTLDFDLERKTKYVRDILDAYEISNMNDVNLDELVKKVLDRRYLVVNFKDLVKHGVDVTEYNLSQLKTLSNLMKQGRDIGPISDPSIPATKMKKYYSSVNSEEFKEALQLLKLNVTKLRKMKILNYDKLAAGQRFVYLWYLERLYTKDEVETQLKILEELPQVHSARLSSGSVENYPAHKITLVPEVTDDTSLGSASNHTPVTKKPKLQENQYKITYTEFTGTWDDRNGIEVLHTIETFDNDLECFQWVVENLIDLDQYDFVPLDLDSESSIRNLLDIVNDNDEESVWHLILKITRGNKTIYKI